MSLYQRLSGLKKASNSTIPGLSRDPNAHDHLPGVEEKNAFGSYLVVEEEHEPVFGLPQKSPVFYCENLQLLYGIGPATEARLKNEGYRTLQDLTAHQRWKDQAQAAEACLQKQDIAGLRRMGAGDEDILPFFCADDIVFLDIETTGLWFTQPLFLVGLLYYDGGKLRSRQLLARNLKEEKPLLAGLIEDLKRFSLIVTYNGRSFDIPYIENRTVAHRLFYRTHHEQVDLLKHARRHFRGVFPDCRLVTLEEHLLHKKREDDVPGSMIPTVYHRFVRTGDGRLIRGIMDHNREDLLAMESLLPMATRGFDPGTLFSFHPRRIDAGGSSMEDE